MRVALELSTGLAKVLYDWYRAKRTASSRASSDVYLSSSSACRSTDRLLFVRVLQIEITSTWLTWTWDSHDVRHRFNFISSTISQTWKWKQREVVRSCKNHFSSIAFWLWTRLNDICSFSRTQKKQWAPQLIGCSVQWRKSFFCMDDKNRWKNTPRLNKMWRYTSVFFSTHTVEKVEYRHTALKQE